MAFLSAKPVGPGRSLPRRSGMAYQARPVRQRVSARHRTWAQGNPDLFIGGRRTIGWQGRVKHACFFPLNLLTAIGDSPW